MPTDRDYVKASYWDNHAATFDSEIDHGLTTKASYLAWTRLLEPYLDKDNLRILDLGCGTGSLSLLLDSLGHAVHGIDFSTEMIAQATRKAKDRDSKAMFSVMDAADITLPDNSFDLLLCRHLLWIFDDTAAILRAWRDLLADSGKIILVEGYWVNCGIRMRTAIDEMNGLYTIENKKNAQQR